MDPRSSNTCVRGKQLGISKQHITGYVQQCQQHIDTQHAYVPGLANTESEVYLSSQSKAAVQHSTQPPVGPCKLQVCETNS